MANRLPPAAQAILQNVGSEMGYNMQSNRALNPTWSTLVQNAGDSHSKALLQFSVAQTLEQSNLSLSKRSQIYDELSPAIASSDVSTISQRMTDIGMRDKYLAHTQWLTSNKGMRFIQNELPGIRQVEAFGMAPGHVSWKGIESSNASFLQGMKERVARQIGVDTNLLSLSYSGGHEASFDIHGLGKQTSRVHELQFQIQSEGIKFKLPLYQASEHGFLVQSRDTVTRGFTKGESVFVTPENYFTNLKYNKATQQHSLEQISGKNAFWNFQMSQVEQLNRRIRAVRSNPNYSLEFKQNRIQQLVGTFKQAQEKNQFFVGSAGVLKGSMSEAGVGQFTQNMLSKAAVMRQTAGLETGLSDLRRTEDPRIVYELMRQKGVSFDMSSGQAGKVRGLMQPGYRAGVMRLPHMEPHKALSELTPARAGMGDTVGGLIPRNVDLYKSANESLVTGSAKKLFSPVGVQAVATLIPDTMATARKAGMGFSELVIPEGTVLANEKLFKSGAMDIGQSVSYHIKASGPGSVGGGLFGETVASILAGGEVTSTADPTKKVMIPGLKASRNAQGQVDFLRAAGVQSQEQFQKLFPGGIPLRQGEFLGLDPGTGRQVSSIADANITEKIIGIGRGSSPEDINLLVSRHVKSTVDDQGRLVANDYKLVSTLLTKEGQAMKLQTHAASDQQFKNLIAASLQDTNLPGSSLPSNTAVRAGMRTEMALHSSTIKDPALRLSAMSGAVRFEMEDKLQSIWKSAGAAKNARQQAMKRMASLSSEEFLKSVASGSILQDLGKVVNLSDPKMSKVKQILSETGKRSMEQRIAAVSIALFGNLPEQQKMQALGNVFAPFTEYGKSMGLLGGQDTVSRYFDWSGRTTPRILGSPEAADWRAGKTILKELDEAFSGQVTQGGKSLASSVIGSSEPFRFYTPGFAPRDYGALLGTGVRASLEPRFFDIAMATPELQPVFKEITSRTTDMGNVMGKLSQTLRGQAPKHVESMLLKDAIGDIGKDLIGNKDLAINLGLTKDVLSKVQTRMSQINPELGAKIMPQVFVPGGEDIRGMGMMVTGTGVEKAKPIRQVYMEYLNSVQTAKNMTGTDQVNALAKATTDFQSNIRNIFKTQYFGAPGGAAHGVLRSPVKGSAYLQLKAPGADFLEVMGVIPKSRSWDKNANIISHFKDQFSKTLQSGESIGRQLILSEKAAEQMFGEAIADASNKGDKNLAHLLRQQRKQLMQGESVLAMASRHPGIGIKSATAARIWIDKFSAESSKQHYVRGGNEFIEVMKGEISSKGASNQARDLFSTAIAQDLNMDWDGDRINVFLAGKRDSQTALNQLMKQEHTHAMKYQLMKDIAKRSISRQAEMHAGGVSALQAFASETQGAFSTEAEAAMRQAAKTEMSSVLAHGAPKTIVPKISNTFTEMKHIVAFSSLGGEAKADLFRFFEAAEQVPISSKHLVKQADFGMEFVSQMQRMRASMFEEAGIRNKAIDNMFKIVADDEIATKASAELLGDSANQMKVQIDYSTMKSNLVNALDEFEGRKEGKQFLDFYRKKTSAGNLSIDDALQAFEHHKPMLSKIYGHNMNFPKGSIDMSRNVLSTINEGIERAGQSAAGKLPTKGIVGLAMTAAAGMLVAGGASIALGPTWNDAASGGAYADPDYLFPDEMESKNAMLHGGSIPTPVSGNLVTPSYEATIHMAPGSYSANSLAGRLGTIMAANASSGRLELNDHRSSLDALTLNRIKNEII